MELDAPQSAAAQLDRLEERIRSLDRMPERHHRYRREPWHSQGLRVMPVDRYCVFYLPDRERQRVSILRVLYGGQDIDTILAGTEEDR